MEVFKRVKPYTGALKQEGKTNRWISDRPLFTYGNKGLFPVFKTGGPTGIFPKNHQELILKKLGEEDGKRSVQISSSRESKKIQDFI
jgi:hypothetical protein